MRNSFTLIELIFVILIIGLLASVAAPKFYATMFNASITKSKSNAATIQTKIEDIHGKWIINDDLDTNDGYTPQGYPQKLDDAQANKADEDLFSKVLKKPIKSCLSNNCWYKSKADDTDNNLSFYTYKLNDKEKIDYEYNGSNGLFIETNSTL